MYLGSLPYGYDSWRTREPDYYDGLDELAYQAKALLDMLEENENVSSKDWEDAQRTYNRCIDAQDYADFIDDWSEFID